MEETAETPVMASTQVAESVVPARVGAEQVASKLFEAPAALITVSQTPQIDLITCPETHGRGVPDGFAAACLRMAWRSF
jgi:hypothetical protein